ncbi:hypothetical protein CLV43_108372 [Umezawaea tangerina]|uniref:Uncharacterized protein n=2 Tax=Umezawaea tangerina TaxID=84725 RepID=A0A2T0SZX4_9PSEU|nr:hypothetical protein CLV43_108372 [Umezawaea tangerina]
MADDNPGFTIQNGTFFATGDGSGLKKEDYDNWDWHRIEAAITGFSSVPPDMKVDFSSGPSNPSTLWNAALAFRSVQEILFQIGSTTREQAKTLAGEDGYWKGEAATAFLQLMTQFGNAFTSHARQLAGGPAHISPVPESLWAAGSYLDWARRTIYEIDAHYGNEAIKVATMFGSAVVDELIMDNKMVKISSYPFIVAMMEADMRKVLKILAAEYEKSKFDNTLVSVPTPGSGTGPPPPNKPFVTSERPPALGPPFTGIEAPMEVQPPPGLGIPPELGSAMHVPAGMAEGPGLSPFDQAALTGPGSGAGRPPGFEPTGFPAMVPPSFDGPPASEGVGAPPSLQPFAPSSLPPSGSGLNGSGPGNRVNLPSGQKPGSGAGATSPNLPELEPFEPSEPPDLADWAADKALDSLDSADQRGAGVPGGALGGMPMMPPMSPPAGPGAGGSERSDASGLLGGEVASWEGADLAGIGDPEALADLAEGKEKWEAPSLGAGVPGGMPMVPPMSPPAGSGAGGSERSDASGLLGGEVASWEGADLAGIGDPVADEALPEGEAQTWASVMSSGVPVDGLLLEVPNESVEPVVNGFGEPDDRVHGRPVAPGVPDGDTAAWEGASAPGQPLGTATRSASLLPGAPVLPAPAAPVVSNVPARADSSALIADDRASSAVPSDPGASRQEDERGGPGSGVPLPPESLEERIAVVRPPDADEDFGAWDVPASTGLLWAVPAPGRTAEDDDEAEPHTPDHTVRGTTPWESVTNHAAARSAVDVKALGSRSFRDGSEFLPRPDRPEDLRRCGSAEHDAEAQPAEEEVARAAEEGETAEEEQTPTSADLLRQDGGAWAEASRPRTTGVIE